MYLHEVPSYRIHEIPCNQIHGNAETIEEHSIPRGTQDFWMFMHLVPPLMTFSSFIMGANIRMKRSYALSVLTTQLPQAQHSMLPSLSTRTHQGCNRLDPWPRTQLPELELFLWLWLKNLEDFLICCLHTSPPLLLASWEK